MILVINKKASQKQVQAMSEDYSGLIKIAVDIRRGILAGGGEMHVDCEQALLEQGSDQDDIWGANWIPITKQIEFEALINIRPNLGNRSILIKDEEVRRKIERITRSILDI